MNLAADQADFAALGRSAHALKSISSYLGATKVHELSEYLEKYAPGVVDKAQVLPTLLELEREVNAATAALLAYNGEGAGPVTDAVRNPGVPI